MSSSICIVGIGKGGRRIAEEAARASSKNVAVFAVDTDAAGLRESGLSSGLLIGKDELRGEGTGGDAGKGRQAGEGAAAELGVKFSEMELVVVVTCLGGGTGSGATPPVLGAARDVGAVTVCIAIMPSEAEGEHRRQLADAAVPEIRRNSNALVLVESDKVLDSAGEVAVGQTYGIVDKTMGMAIGAIWSAMTDPEHPSIDVGDFCGMIKHCGGCGILGFGFADGDARTEKAVASLMENPMLDGGRILKNSAAAIIGIAGGADMTVSEHRKVKSAIVAGIGKACRTLTGTAVSAEWRGIGISAIAFEQYTPPHPAAAQRQSPAVSGKEPQQSAKPGKKTEQVELTFDAFAEKGRFKDSSPTMQDGTDLDTPTFMRRGIVIQR